MRISWDTRGQDGATGLDGEMDGTHRRFDFVMSFRGHPLGELGLTAAGVLLAEAGVDAFPVSLTLWGSVLDRLGGHQRSTAEIVQITSQPYCAAVL